jgi:hypothetical protein
MSTKTTFKRIALVAVVALGLGSLSTVPAGAATAVGMVESISLATTTSSPKVGSAVAVNFGAAIGNVTGAANGDDLLFTGYLSTYPSGGYAGVTASETATGTDGELAGVTAAVGAQANTAESASGSNYSVDLTTAASLSDNDPSSEGNITATITQGAGKFSFTPTVEGTHVLTVWFDNDGDGVIDIGEAVQTISITVAAATGYSNSLSTSIVNDTADTTYDATVDTEIRVSKSAGTDAATIVVTLKDSSGAAINGLKVAAEVSGPGLVDVVDSGNYADASVRADSATLVDNVANVHVTADGTGGEGTVTIKIQNATTGATLGTLATEKIYFYGTVATLTATANYTIARANATERGCANATTCTQLSFDTTPFVQIKATDSSGNLVPGLTVTSSITSVEVIQASTVAAVTSAASLSTAGVSTDLNGLGFYNASVAGAVSATSGQSTTVTYRTTLSDGSRITSNAVTFTIGGGISTETLAFDKAVYEPGEAMVVTRTAKDSAGNPVYDGVAAPEVTFNKAVAGTIGASTYKGGVKATSSTAPSVFAPASSGKFTGQMTSGNAAGTLIKAEATVSDDAATSASSAAADAAAEATDAANAATDAANAAAEAADAATAAAQDAADAVAALSTSVSAMVSDLKKQITALTNLVIKIQKKVKA